MSVSQLRPYGRYSGLISSNHRQLKVNAGKDKNNKEPDKSDSDEEDDSGNEEIDSNEDEQADVNSDVEHDYYNTEKF